MHLIQRLGILLFALLAIQNGAFASQTDKQNACDKALTGRNPTLHELIQNAMRDQAALRQEIPLRTFIDPDVDQHRVEDGVMGPRALADLHPPRMAFQLLQAPFPEPNAVIKMDSPGSSIPLRNRSNFAGQAVATTIYASMPGKIKNNATPNRGNGQFQRSYLIGPEYKNTGVIYWMHGGGTPTATGVNAMSVGLETGKRGIPLIAGDGPGHGNASLFPFLNGQEMIDYHLQVMRDTIHPDVPIIVMGHSWGGQFAVQMYLLWPRLKKHGLNIKGLVALAPPADMSLGGTASQRQAADKKVEDCFEEWKGDVAEGDYDFIENTVRNGKTSPVAGLYCTLSALDYSWKMPMDGVARPRMMVIVGESDGLVYTGREAAFDQFLRKLVAPQDYILMGKGRTFKGQDVQTGHNVFDRYMDAADRDQIADFLGNEKDKETVAEAYTRIGYFVQQQVGHPLPKLSNEVPVLPKDATPEERAQDLHARAEAAIDRIYRLYANHLTFRQLVTTFVHRDFKRTNETARLQARRKILEKYINAATEASEQSQRKVADLILKQIKAANEKWRVQAPAVARKELALVQDPKRTEALKAALALAEPIRDQIRAENPDNTQSLILAMSRPVGIETIEQAQKELEKGPDKDRRKALETFLLNARSIVNQYRRDLGAKISAALLKIQFPAGAKSIDEILWELNLDTSAQRKQDLQAYLKEIEAIEVSKDDLALQTLKNAIAAVSLPPGTTSYEAALKEAEEIRAKIELNYVPEGPMAEKTKQKIQRMQDTTDSIAKMGKELDELVKLIAGLKKRRADQLKAIEAERSFVLPAELESQIVRREQALDAYIAANKEYEKYVSERIASAHESGKLTRAMLQQLFKEVQPYVDKYNRGRNHFLSASRQVEETRMKLAREGVLGPQLQQLMITLYGADGKGGLEHQLAMHQQSRDRMLEVRANLRAEAHALRKRYHELVPGYYQLVEQDLKSLLDLPYQDLLQHLKDPQTGPFLMETLTAAAEEFESMWKLRDAPEKKGADIN
ncbi:MAG: alpha/beta fold hydrolase [Bdellovibrionales bacterium]